MNEAYLHYKPIAAASEGVELLQKANVTELNPEQGVVVAEGDRANNAFLDDFVAAMKQHRFYSRDAETVPK